MKKTLFVLPIAALAIQANVAIAAPNGKPFQELAAGIEQNSQLIAENSEAISDLNTAMAEVQGKADAIEKTVSDLQASIASHLVSIAGIDERLDNLEGNFDDLSAGLTSERDDIDATLDSLQDQIDDVKTELNTLSSTSVSLAERIDELEANGGGNIGELTTDLAQLNAQYNALSTNYDLLQESYAALSELFDGMNEILEAHLNEVPLDEYYPPSSHLVYSEAFKQEVFETPVQWEHWENFRRGLNGNYSKISFSSSRGGYVGCTDPETVTLIAEALAMGLQRTYDCDDNKWVVDYCKDYLELTVNKTGTHCKCTNGATLRPRPDDRGQWGGVDEIYGGTNNGATFGTCGAVDQVLTVALER